MNLFGKLISKLLSFMFIYLLIACNVSDDKGPEYYEALFVHEIIPVLESKCMSCHGNDPLKIEGGIDLSNYSNILKGGDSGTPTVVQGNPSKSMLMHAIKRESDQYAMPPKVGDKLSQMDIEIIEKWIDGGAPWPDEHQIVEILKDTTWSYGDRVKVATSGGLSETWDNRRYQKENLWAYYPVKKYEVPWNKTDGGKGNPIDAFLDASRAELGIGKAERASKRILLRRATIDLTGLPPTLAEINAFIEDDSDDAFSSVIERLLKSPHYGEQWGRHWLDVVRYADSGGFSNDFMRPNAWRYRDYVVRSFNMDKRFDRFVAEQLAGDELNPNDPESLIATGFLRMGPWEHTGMSVAAETRQFYLDDVTNIVGEAFLATPLSCAKCHDHKYDPIPAKDYYSVQAVFATTQFADREADFLEAENIDLSESEYERILNWIDKTEEERQILLKKEEDAARDWYDKNGMTYLPKRERRKLPDHQQPPRYLGLSFDDLGYRKVLQKRAQLLKRQKVRFEPKVYSVYNGPDRVIHSRDFQSIPASLDDPAPETFILTGGSVYAPSDPVGPAALSIVNTIYEKESHQKFADQQIPSTISGRRTAFAKWLTNPSNPILARSMVNRIWQYHFGVGLVDTPNNFGATGGKPTHPKLLDWLANYFIENGWSIKKMHRLIMTSEAYQMSSSHENRKKLDRLDPDNDYLSYFNVRRMEAEEIKDAMLMISGEINLKVGGFPVRPEINQEVALQPRHTMGSIAPAYQPSRTPEERNRRSIYAEKYRTLIDPDLEVFNQPGSDMSCERRNESTVTPQAFTQFNGLHTKKRSLALAHELMLKSESTKAAIQECSKLIWNRVANKKEVKKSLEYHDKMVKYHTENDPIAMEYPTSIKREMFEEMTGQSFSYEEELDIYKNYVPDLQASEVDIETRALADLVAVFFNSNEFMYVY